MTRQVRLVLEYMDKGTLRDALDSGIFINPAGDEVDYEAVLETVAEVAKGMLHLHSLNILHGDLKVSLGGPHNVEIRAMSAGQSVCQLSQRASHALDHS